MDVTDLRLLRFFNAKKNPNEDEIELLKNYIPRFKYPMGAIFSVIGLIRNEAYLIDYARDYNYFKPIIDEVYEEYYTEGERTVLCHFFSLFIFQIQGINIEYLPQLKEAFQVESDKTEIIQLKTEIKYRYVLALIIHSIGDDEEIDQLLSELEQEQEYDRIALAEKYISE